MDSTASADRSGAAPVARPERAGVVSVVMIFWNAGRFLREAVESVEAQTYPEWELLLVDDGSDDAGPQLAEHLAESQPGKIRYLTHPGRTHLGTAASRNLGLAAATGEFVAFLDADDIYLPQRLERHVRILREMPFVDMVQSDHVKWHTWGEGEGRFEELLSRPPVALSGRVLRPPLGLVTILAVPSMVPGICDVTVRSGVGRQLGSIDPEFRLHFEDQVFISKVYLERIAYALPEILARYRRHPDSSTIRYQETTAVFDRDATAAMRSFYAWLQNYVLAKGVHDPLLDRLLSARVRSSIRLGATIRRAAALTVTRIKRVLRMLRASTAYRAVLRLENRLSGGRALRRYRRLCLEASDIAAQEAGARRLDD